MRDLSQRWDVVVASLDVATGRQHRPTVGIDQLGLIRVTALAGSEAGLDSRLGAEKKERVFALWPATGTLGPAKNTSRGHAEKKDAVIMAVALGDGLPERTFRQV
jgi:hypothetical protein